MAMILEHVNYSYGVGTGKEFHALKDINLQIGDHEFIGLMGHSGSGKSTLIQLMNGLLRATEGTIYWMDKIFMTNLFRCGVCVDKLV